jgi:hypothetical protein
LLPGAAIGIEKAIGKLQGYSGSGPGLREAAAKHTADVIQIVHAGGGTGQNGSGACIKALREGDIDGVVD